LIEGKGELLRKELPDGEPEWQGITP